MINARSASNTAKTSKSRESCKAEAPFAALTRKQIDASRSTKPSFLLAKIFPEVTLNW